MWYVGFQSFSFLSYYFLEFYDFIFYFQETYNIRLKERYRDDPDLWLEAGSSGGSDRNRVYGLSNTIAENLRTAHSISTIGSSQSIPSTQSLEFAALLNQGVQEHTTHLHEKYEQLSMDYELRQMVIDIKSHVGDTCAPLLGTTNLLLLLLF